MTSKSPKFYKVVEKSLKEGRLLGLGQSLIHTAVDATAIWKIETVLATETNEIVNSTRDHRFENMMTAGRRRQHGGVIMTALWWYIS